MYKWFVDVQAQGAQLGQTAASYQPAADQGARTRDEETSAFCHWPVDVQDLNSPAAVDLKVDPRPTLLFMEKSSHGLEIDRVRPPLLQGPACRYSAHEV